MTTTEETKVTGQQVYEEQRLLQKLERELSDAYYQANEALRKGAFTDPFAFTARERKAVEEQQTVVIDAQAQVGGPVYRIPAANVDHLKNEIANKVNKRADKLELPRIQVIDLEQEIIESPDYDNRDEHGKPGVKRHVFQYVAIKGETPRIAGYEFVATLQHEEAGNIVRKIPTLRQEIRNIEIPDLTEYRNVDPICDHCGLRRNRKDTYLVFNSDTGEIQQVGSNCLGDFLGSADPQRYAGYAEYLRDFLDNLQDDIDEDRYYGPRAETAFEMRDFLASTARMIRADGWNPASTSDHPTSVQAWDNLENYGKKDKYTGQPLWLDIEDQDYLLADETLEWAHTDLFDREDKSDYMHNLSVALQAKGVTYRTKGIVASAVRAFDREREDALRREKQAKENATKEWVGEIDERRDWNLTLIKTIWIRNDYATSDYDTYKPLYIFNDESGNEIKWFASRDLNLHEGDDYTIKATVKKHEDHSKFGKSTVITRGKVQ